MAVHDRTRLIDRLPTPFFVVLPPIFRRLERQLLADLLRGASKAAFKAGAMVFDKGAEGHSLYVVVRGSFEVYRLLIADEEIVFHRSARRIG